MSLNPLLRRLAAPIASRVAWSIAGGLGAMYAHHFSAEDLSTLNSAAEILIVALTGFLAELVSE